MSRSIKNEPDTVKPKRIVEKKTISTGLDKIYNGLLNQIKYFKHQMRCTLQQDYERRNGARRMEELLPRSHI